MKVTTFTDTMIRKLKPEEKKYIRGEGNGFSIRVMPSGVKTWLYVYSIDGKRREMNLGPYPDISLSVARDKFDAAKKLVVKGIDPLAIAESQKEERRKAPTVTDLCDEYLKKHAKKNKKSWEQDEAYINREIIPVWGKRKAADIRKRDLTLLLEEIIERGSPVTSNRVRALIQKMFNFAVERDILEYNPCSAVKPMHKEKPKERNLSEDEILTLWQNLEKPDVIMSQNLKRALKLILVTAQRPGEVTGMHRKEIHGHWWTIPSERSKNGKAHRVYLTKIALELIGDKKGFIFESPKTDKNDNPQPIDEKGLARALRRNIKGENYLQDKVKRRKGKEYVRGAYKAKPLPEEPNRLGVEHFTPHDLRRTATSLMAAAKVIREHRERVLNHTLERMDGTYNQHDYDDEKKLALETLERKLNAIITGNGQGKVIHASFRG